MNITQLIQQVKKGDAKAEKILYEYCYQQCFKIALVYCKDKTEAIHVFNHTMVDAFDALFIMSQPEGLIKWVARALKNDCLDHIRKQTTYQNKIALFTMSRSVEVSFNEAIASLAMEEILQLINELKPEYRLCFIMHALDSYTYREISDELDININTAKWYVSEAKKLLQEKLLYLKEG